MDRPAPAPMTVPLMRETWLQNS